MSTFAYLKSNTMALILLENMEFFAYHGCFAEEQIIGNRFIVNLTIETDTSAAETSDNLHHTVNYQTVYNIVKKEMAIKSKLLEHVASRIINEVKKNFPQITRLIVKISKINPPLGGKLENVSVQIEI
jgi:7,8-dihydroneopterin aldolase/epimerase/oxygenase